MRRQPADPPLPMDDAAVRTRVVTAQRPKEEASHWRNLAAMERWEAHPTHVAIFGGFMRIVQELNFDVKLKLYHEVSILRPEEQGFEYINCHGKTGLMNAID